jgi:signal transduction histidine kinase
MNRSSILSSRVLDIWLAVGVCSSVLVLIGFGYRATREWKRSSALVVERRENQAADLLVTALTRDMQAVQRSVLSSAEWDVSTLDSPYDIANIVASAFARYPYPESFFTDRGALTARTVMFFTRSSRPPPWAPADSGSNRFPVSVQDGAPIAPRIVGRLAPDAAAGRRFSIFDLDVGGTSYQVVARLIYRDQLREHLDGVFGFMVDMSWARQHYFSDLTSQVARIGGPTQGLVLGVSDDVGARVASTQELVGAGPARRRSFPLTFFDPLLIAVDQPADLSRREWFVEVSGAADPALAAAINSANRTLILSGIAGAMLAIAMVLMARAVRARANLAELRSEFVSSVTHELKTPIAAIRAAGDTLVSGRIASPSGRREYAQMVVQEAKRLTRLVDNLLALSRITDVTEVYSFEPFALETLVEHTMKDFQHQFTEAGFETHVDIPANIPLVRADRTAMRLMLDNLVDNAIRYSPTSKSVAVTARRENGAVVVDVIDRGRGIPADEIELVTRRFFRGRHFISNGSGLGLAIVKRVVADHGGRLDIHSTVDIGTTVSVTLPIWRDDEETDSRR